MAMRYNLNLRQELEKSIRNFNAKINRLNRISNDLTLPSKLNYNELIGDVKSTKELRDLISNIKRFSKRGAEEQIVTQGGVTTNKYELETLRRDTKRIKQRLTREIHKLENIVPTSLGVKQDFTLKAIPTDRLVNLKARRESLDKDILKLDKDQFTYYLKKIESNVKPSKYRNELYQNNYIDKMLLFLGYQVGYDNKKLEYIRSRLNELPTGEFLKLMDTEKIVLDIQNFYGETTMKRGRVNAGTIDTIYSRFDMLYENIDKIISNYK